MKEVMKDDNIYVKRTYMKQPDGSWFVYNSKPYKRVWVDKFFYDDLECEYYDGYWREEDL